MAGVIGVLYGMEESFPPALVERINAMGAPGVSAESVTIGDVAAQVIGGHDPVS